MSVIHQTYQTNYPTMNTEQKCCNKCYFEESCSGAPRCSSTVCPCHTKDPRDRNSLKVLNSGFKTHYTEQKGWRDTPSLAEDLHGRIARSWGNADDVRGEIEHFIERTLQEQREEMVRKLLKDYDENCGGVMDTECEHGFKPAWDCKNRHCDIRLFWRARQLISALIKDTHI